LRNLLTRQVRAGQGDWEIIETCGGQRDWEGMPHAADKERDGSTDPNVIVFDITYGQPLLIFVHMRPGHKHLPWQEFKVC